jgi:site-specific recombinase XerD
MNRQCIGHNNNSRLTSNTRFSFLCNPTFGLERFRKSGAFANQAAARNRAILWVLFDTGMHATEVCALHLFDVDRQQGMVRVQGKGRAVLWLMLGHERQRSLFMYLDHYRLKKTTHFKQDDANTEPLFLSETGHPLKKGAIGLLFGRLRERVAMSRKDIRASLLRKNVAMRYGLDPILES